MEAKKESQPHVSVSQLRTYRRCGEQYRFRYQEGLRMAPGIAMIKGTGMHRAAALNHAQKIESRVDLPTEDMACAAADAVESEFAGGVALTAEEQTVGLATMRGRTVDGAVKLTRLYASDLAPGIQPTMSEKRLLMTPPPGSNLERPVELIIDLAEEGDRVRDFKTTSKSPSESEAGRSDQLSVYGLGYEALTGRPAKELELSYLVLTAAGNTKVVRQTTTRTREDYQAVIETMARAVHGIQAGVFVPNTEWWGCDERYCGFSNICRFYRGNR